MKKIPILFLVITAVFGITVEWITSSNFKFFLIANIATLAIFPLSLLFMRLQVNFYTWLNKAPLFNVGDNKTKYLDIGAIIISIISILYYVVVILKTSGVQFRNESQLVGLCIGYSGLLIRNYRKVEA